MRKKEARFVGARDLGTVMAVPVYVPGGNLYTVGVRESGNGVCEEGLPKLPSLMVGPLFVILYEASKVKPHADERSTCAAENGPSTRKEKIWANG